MGLSDNSSARQVLRVDGSAFRSDDTAIVFNVSRGVSIGDDISHGANGGYGGFDGRFAEVVIYNRGLSTTEIASVECYLLEKWKPSKMASSCKPVLSLTSISTPWNDGTNAPFNAPGHDVTSTLTLTRSAGVRLGNNSVFAVYTLAGELVFFNGDADGAAAGANPVNFDGGSSGLTFNYATDVRYSNNGPAPTSFAACTYTPTSGYDSAVRHICLNPKGYFAGGSSSASVQFSFRARIN